MHLSETIKLYVTKDQRELITKAMMEYINTVNSLVSEAMKGVPVKRYTTKDVSAELPSAIINQAIRDANSIVRKHYKACMKTVFRNRKLREEGKNITFLAPHVPVLKRLCLYINNQSYRIIDNCISFPVITGGKSKRLFVKTKMTDTQKAVLSAHKLGTMRIVIKNGTLVCQPVYEKEESSYKDEGNVMGIDLGIKCPAVSYISDGSVKFYGNGRRNKYIRRHYAYLRKRLQRAKHMNTVKRIDNKEQRIMKDIDHKISHDIIETAASHNVKVIKLERLSNIRSTARKSRKNEHSLHNWSFYRLAQFIEYKARLAGITVEYVNPAYTSQRCPICGNIHHADDRNYVCECGFHTHRDLLGAMNICNSTEYVGNRHTA